MRPARLSLVVAILAGLAACREDSAAPEPTAGAAAVRPPLDRAFADPSAETPAAAAAEDPGPFDPDAPAVATIAPPAEPSPSTAPAVTAPEETPSVPPFTPLQDAVPGEWALYDAGGGRTLRYEVIDGDVDGVQTRITILQDGKVLGQPAVRADVRIYDPLLRQANRAGASRTVRHERIPLAGRTWNALRYEDRWTDEGVAYVRRTWVSPDAPCFGLLRMELLGDGRAEARCELKAYGTSPR
jgi:hypothetical protein